MDREQVLAVIDAAYAARMQGDQAALERVFAPGATFELAGDTALLAAFPGAGVGAALPTVQAIMALVAMSKVERIDAVVEGRRAAVLSRVTLAFGRRPPYVSMLYDLWELDAEGRVTSLLQFADSALIAREMAGLAVA